MKEKRLTFAEKDKAFLQSILDEEVSILNEYARKNPGDFQSRQAIYEIDNKLLSFIVFQLQPDTYLLLDNIKKSGASGIYIKVRVLKKKNLDSAFELTDKIMGLKFRFRYPIGPKLIEHIEGPELQDLINEIQDGKSISPISCKNIIISLLQEIFDLHKNDYLHGDVHSQNIIIAEKYQSCLVDIDDANAIERIENIEGVPRQKVTSNFCFREISIVTEKKQIYERYSDFFSVAITILNLISVMYKRFKEPYLIPYFSLVLAILTKEKEFERIEDCKLYLETCNDINEKKKNEILSNLAQELLRFLKKVKKKFPVADLGNESRSGISLNIPHNTYVNIFFLIKMYLEILKNIYPKFIYIKETEHIIEYYTEVIGKLNNEVEDSENADSNDKKVVYSHESSEKCSSLNKEIEESDNKTYPADNHLEISEKDILTQEKLQRFTDLHFKIAQDDFELTYPNDSHADIKTKNANAQVFYAEISALINNRIQEKSNKIIYFNKESFHPDYEFLKELYSNAFSYLLLQYAFKPTEVNKERLKDLVTSICQALMIIDVNDFCEALVKAETKLAVDDQSALKYYLSDAISKKMKLIQAQDEKLSEELAKEATSKYTMALGIFRPMPPFNNTNSETQPGTKPIPIIIQRSSPKQNEHLNQNLSRSAQESKGNDAFDFFSPNKTISK